MLEGNQNRKGKYLLHFYKAVSLACFGLCLLLPVAKSTAGLTLELMTPLSNVSPSQSAVFIFCFP